LIQKQRRQLKGSASSPNCFADTFFSVIVLSNFVFKAIYWSDLIICALQWRVKL